MRRRLATALVLLTGVGATTAAAQAPLPATEALSTNVQSLVNNGMLGGPYLANAAASGWRAARGDAFWFDVEPVGGTYSWTKLDAVKSAMDAAGIRWQPILSGSPAWARDSANPLDPPAERAYPDFARFAAAFAARYGPGGAMAGAWPVTDVEINNEMDVLWARGAASYAELYAQARAAIRAAQPSMRVVVGAILYDSVAPTDADWIRAFFTALAGRGADAIGLHPYAPTAIGVVANLRRMQQGLVDAGEGGLPIYVNELGYPAALDGAAPKQRAADGAVTDQARAGTTTLLTDALLASDCGIRNIGYFDLVNQELRTAVSDYAASETWKGLLRRADGSLTVTGTAFRDAGARWAAAPVPGTVHVCGASAPAGTAPLPLELEIERPTATCLRPRVTYRGFPIEEATVTIGTREGATSSLLTDATGALPRDFCGEAGVTLSVQAQVSYVPMAIPTFARSPAFTCPGGSTVPCTVVSDGGGGASGTTVSRTAATLSAQASCLLRKLQVRGSRRLPAALARGVRLRASGCRPAATAAAAIKTIRVTGTVDRRDALRLRLVRALPKVGVPVAAAGLRVTRADAVTVTVRFTARARARLRRAARVSVRLSIALTEGRLRRTVVRQVLLRR